MTTPPLGPNPLHLTRTQYESLYETLSKLQEVLFHLQIPYIVTGGSLLGAVRQQSILFCDDDIDVGLLVDEEQRKSTLDSIQDAFKEDKRFLYQREPWEGGDRIRHVCHHVFVDVFCIRPYENMDDLRTVIGWKRNGQAQSEEYVTGIQDTIADCIGSARPFYHFCTRKAIELWTKEVYLEHELYPLSSLRLGPLTVPGPRMPLQQLYRAFGNDCLHVYYASSSHQETSVTHTHVQDSSNTPLTPIVGAGGTWQHHTKTELSDEQYLSTQPEARSKRWASTHSKASLMEYVERQQEQERLWEEEETRRKTDDVIDKIQSLPRPRRTVYMDGVFDLFHIGHLKAIQQCIALGDRVIIGVTGDKDAASYKRPPIIDETQRSSIIRALRHVDDVVCPCPLVVNQKFMEEWQIDLVVHGYANDVDADAQEEFFRYPMSQGKFRRIEYYKDLSTTDILDRIRHEPPPHKWFGESLAIVTAGAPDLPFDPFPLQLRQCIQPHIHLGIEKRTKALAAIEKATGSTLYQETITDFTNRLGIEGSYTFDTSTERVREALLAAGGLHRDFDLSKIHELPDGKERMLHHMTTDYQAFQQVYDAFVRRVCVPYLASKMNAQTGDIFYYQAFPCVRVVMPNEFSIGPHADVSYGHHPCTTNFYVPLTNIRYSTSSVFLESRRGSEDWHPMLYDYGMFGLT